MPNRAGERLKSYPTLVLDMSFMDTLALPSEMTSLDQWIVWKVEQRNGKDTKIPVSPHTERFGATDDPDTWATYEKASGLVNENDKYGLGFVFTEDDDLVGIDLDHVRDPDTGRVTDDRAKEIINQLDSYTEISPSGEGYHVIVKGRLPSGRNRKGEIEMYDSGRFFTVTGNRVPGTEPEVKNRDSPLRVVHNKFLRESMTNQNQSTTSNAGNPEIELDDNEVLKKAKNSKSGKKFEALWNGITSGYDSHSEADLALCSYLAFWTGGDKQQMDTLFRKSGLMRDKWDREHSSNGKTYGEMTIEKAIQTSDSFYGQN